jgi:NADH-quinone oxidoreductase subunit J
MSGAQIVFLVLAAVALLGALGVVGYGSKPVWSAICLVVNFFVLGLIYFSMGAQFLGIVQIMVYAGAIMVLFLFVIMILRLASNAQKEEESSPVVRLLALASGLGFAGIIFASVIWPLSNLSQDTMTPRFASELAKPQAIGMTLYSGYVWPFEIASILLLVGVVGSILLAKRRFH